VRAIMPAHVLYSAVLRASPCFRKRNAANSAALAFLRQPHDFVCPFRRLLARVINISPQKQRTSTRALSDPLKGGTCRTIASNGVMPP